MQLIYFWKLLYMFRVDLPPILYYWFRASSLYINKIQQDATDAGIYLLQDYSTCFGCLSHQFSGVCQTVTAVSGTDHITYQGNDLLTAWPNYD